MSGEGKKAVLERESLATEIIEGVADRRDEKIQGMIMRGNGSRRVKNKMTDGEEFKAVKKQSDKRIILSDTILARIIKGVELEMCQVRS